MHFLSGFVFGMLFTATLFMTELIVREHGGIRRLFAKTWNRLFKSHRCIFCAKFHANCCFDGRCAE